MSDTHPRYLVAEGELHRAGDFVIEYQVIDTRPENGNARVLHVGFTEDSAARIAEALNDHPQVERLTGDLRKADLDRELVRVERAGLRQALVDIVQNDSAGRGCSTFTSGSCRDAGSGRTLGAKYGADSWCDSCIAKDALDGSPKGDGQ